MATVYRDYGYLQDSSEPANSFNVNKRGQVYLATHEGERLLPLMKRSFISFSFGYRTEGNKKYPMNIEDFDLIATISNNSLSRQGYAAFEDNTTTYDNLPGQQYWSTHYRTNTIDFTLATDGMTQQKLDQFLYWFRAGETKELILAEHPNRAILARVAQPPELNLLPFEQPTTVIIVGQEYTTSTTLYKGEIQLSLVMDEPHWYALNNILGEKVERDNRVYYEDYWHDPNNPDQKISIFASQDALKILYEDGIPLGSMIKDNMLLGNGAYAQSEDEPRSSTWSLLESDENFASGVGAMIVDNNATDNFTAIIAGAMVDISGNGIEALSAGSEAYFFYSGTAPAPTKLSFSLQPVIDNNTYYITVPKNSIVDSKTPYNTITIKSVHEQEFRFTTPNIFTSYNKVIQIFHNMIKLDSSYTWEQIREKIREKVRHPVIRAWANNILPPMTDNGALAQEDPTSKCSSMSNIFRMTDGGQVTTVDFSFNSEDGQATGKFQYRENTSSTTLITATEDVGDMLKSNYIIISDRNYTTPNGELHKWEDIDKTRSHVFTHDCEGVNLTKISILYKNMYL